MKKSMVVTTIAMILVVVVAITTATFAWFSVSTSATVDGQFTAASGSATINLLDPTGKITYGSTAKADFDAAIGNMSNWGSTLSLGSSTAMQPLVPVVGSTASASGAGADTGLGGTLATSNFNFATDAFADTVKAPSYPDYVYGIQQNPGADINGSSADMFLNLHKQAASAWGAETSYNNDTLQPSLFTATFFLANFSANDITDAPVTITVTANDGANNVAVLNAARFMMAYTPIGTVANTYIYSEGINYGVNYSTNLVYGAAGEQLGTNNSAVSDGYTTALLIKGNAAPSATGTLALGATGTEGNADGTVTKTFNATMPLASAVSDKTKVVAVSLAVWLDGWVLNNAGNTGAISFSLTVAEPTQQS